MDAQAEVNPDHLQATLLLPGHLVIQTNLVISSLALVQVGTPKVHTETKPWV